ncbi:MAG: hypothetical protein ACP5F6_08715 [Microbacter sp.]
MHFLSVSLSDEFSHFTLDNILLIGSVLLFASLLASRSTKYGVPTLLLFMFIGMLAGQNGPGGIVFNDPKIAKFIGTIALSFILFFGRFRNKKTRYKANH